MPTPTTPTPTPVGNTLIRLADIPLKQRQQALHKLLAQHAITPEETEQLLDLILDPGHHSTRIAA